MIRLYIHSRLPEVTSGIKNRSGREFPGSLVIGFTALPAMAQVLSLVREMISHKMHSVARSKR